MNKINIWGREVVRTVFLTGCGAVISVAIGISTLATASADEAVTYGYSGSFEDAAFDVEGAIVAEGLVIDSVSHVGDMLNRTGADVGSAKEIFAKADVFQFCSAVLSRKVMEADPMNIAHCPYGIFVVQDSGSNGQVKIGYRSMPAGPMKEVEAFIDKIVRQVVENQ